MKGEHKRIVELADGWEGSEAVVTLSAADAKLLQAAGASVEGGTKPSDPHRIKGTDLYAAARRIAAQEPGTPEGAAPTPNQQSVTGPGTGAGPDGAPRSPEGDNKPTAPEPPPEPPAGPALIVPPAPPAEETPAVRLPGLKPRK